MAKLPPIKRIHFNELVEAPPWLQTILVTLNSFMQNVYEALDKDLTLEENFRGGFVDITWNGDPLTFTNPLAVPAKAVLIAQIGGSALTGGPVPTWQQVGEDIEISDVTGTTSGESYSIRLLVL